MSSLRNQPGSVAVISSLRKRLGVTLRFLIPVLAVLSFIALAVYFYGARDARQSFLWKDKQASNLLQKELESGFHTVASDVRFLARELSRSHLFDETGGTNSRVLRRIEGSLQNFSQSRGVYDQVRFLDLTGNERVRINFDGSEARSVDSSKLQNKATRYYFQESLSKGEGEVFVSPFDLNMEEGIVEQPLKPMLRFGAPVFDAKGNKRGVVLLNYLGDNLLSMLQDFQLSSHSRSYLVNASGYYLKGPDAAHEWTFMFPEQESNTFALEHPEAWNFIISEGAGQSEIEDGLFTVRSIQWGGNENSASSRKWKLIAHVPAGVLASLDSERAKNVLMFAGGIALVLAIGSWLLAGAVLGRRESEGQLAESRKHLSSIFDTARDAILSFDEKHRIVFWNRSAESLFHYTAEEAKALDFDDLLAPGHTFQEVMQGRLLGASVEGEAFEELIEFAAMRSGNEIFTAEMSLSNWQTDAGSFSTAIMRDNTERKQAEAELMRATEEARQASVAKSDFLANMSHEIRTPMNGVIGMAELLADTPLDVQQKRFVNTITSSGDALLILINDILDLSKIEACKMEMEVIPFNLLSLLEEIADLFAVRADEQGLEFSGFLDLDVFEYVKGDPTHLRQVLTNLTGNALKFTEQGEVAIRGRLVSEDEKQLVVRFDIRDTGIGIAENSIATLFESFTQEDASTTRKFGGTGLGLSISKKLVELMGGEIGIESVKGKGSTFWFTIPLQKQAVEEVEVPWMPADLKDKKVLVVDDHATNREIMRLQLESWGCYVFEASRAREALQMTADAAAKEEPFDILLVDMQMPEMDGEELGRRIIGQSDFPRPLMAMLTSIGHRGDAQRALAAGFNAYLTKPVKKSELRDCLGTLVAKEEALANGNPTTLVTAHSVSEGKRFHMRVLLADDNKINLMVASSMLKKLGVEVETAENGKIAIEKLAGRESEFALVFMDCQMPEMDGFEATSRIRANESEGTRIPVVALTAHALHGDREKCLNAGMDDYLTKPLKLASLREVLERWS